MPKINIDKDRCKGCFLCMSACPKALIKKGDSLNKLGLNYAEFQDKGECVACAFCAIICPECCIEVYK